MKERASGHIRLQPKSGQSQTLWIHDMTEMTEMTKSLTEANAATHAMPGLAGRQRLDVRVSIQGPSHLSKTSLKRSIQKLVLFAHPCLA